ncbi:MAG: hypothetical protein MJ126_04365 [Lachnospiraceae bacterium]|nr:hypothetical protein [Lachnospiraceae bacterium]
MKLISYNTSKAGGMLGGFSSTSITHTEDGRCKVIISNKYTHNDPCIKETYYADGLLEKLSEICERYNIINLKEMPGQTIVMLDDPSGQTSYEFEDGTKIVLEKGKIYPDFDYNMFHEFNELIEESKSYGVDMEVTQETFGMPMGMMGMMGMSMLNGQVTKIDKALDNASQSEDDSKWARFCSNCGNEFVGKQKFCAECGSPRPKL